MDAKNPSLLARLKNSAEHFKDIKFPGTEETIKLKVLTVDEYSKISDGLNKKYNSVNVGVENLDDYNFDRETRMLYFAVCDPDTKQRLFPSLLDIGVALTPETKEILAEELDNLHDECSPDIFRMTDNEFKILLASIKKNAAKTIGKVSNIHTLRRLSLFLANQEKTLQTENGSISTE